MYSHFVSFYHQSERKEINNMRAVFAVVLVALVASSSAIDLSSFGSDLIDQFKETGLTVVQQLVDQGKQLFADSWQVIPNLLSKFLLGKREVIGFGARLQKLGSKVTALIEKAKDYGSAVFTASVDKLKDVLAKFHITMGTNTDLKALEDEVDQVVDQHQAIQKRIFGDLLDQGMALFGGVVDSVKDIAGDLFTSAKAKLSDLASAGLQAGAELLAKTGLLGKRAVLSLSDHLTNIGNALSPILEPFKDIMSGLGSTLKGHFSNIMDSLGGHVTALKDKLSGHITDLAGHGSTLLEHGTNALNALGEVANDVLKQTLENVAPHIDGIAKTLADGASVVGDHLSSGY